jgi:hypothetical protein
VAADGHVHPMIIPGREIRGGESTPCVADRLFFGSSQQLLHGVSPTFGLHQSTVCNGISLTEHPIGWVAPLAAASGRIPSRNDRVKKALKLGKSSPDEQVASVRSMSYRDINIRIRAFFSQTGFSSCASRPTKRESKCCGNIACRAVITDSMSGSVT